MNKQEILSTTGLSESEFYKLYPTEESFKKKNPKMKLGGTLKRAQSGYSFNDPDAPKITTPNSNVLAIQAQQAQAAKRQKERALYARDQYQDLQTHPQLSGVPRTKEELMEEAQRRATNKFALQDKPWSEIVPDVATDAALMMAPELLFGYGLPALKSGMKSIKDIGRIGEATAPDFNFAGKTSGLNSRPAHVPVDNSKWKNLPSRIDKQEIGSYSDIERALEAQSRSEPVPQGLYLKMMDDWQFKGGKWKRPKIGDKLSGYTDVPGFNQEVKNMITKLQYGKRPLETGTTVNPNIQNWIANVLKEEVGANQRADKNIIEKYYPTKYNAKDAWREDMSPNKFGGEPCPECLQKAQDGKTLTPAQAYAASQAIARHNTYGVRGSYDKNADEAYVAQLDSLYRNSKYPIDIKVDSLDKVYPTYHDSFEDKLWSDQKPSARRDAMIYTKPNLSGKSLQWMAENPSPDDSLFENKPNPYYNPAINPYNPVIKKTGGSVGQGIDSTSFLDDRMKKLIIHLKDTSQPAHDRTIQKEAFEEHQQQMQEMMSQFQGQQMDYGQQMPVQRFGGDLPKAQFGPPGDDLHQYGISKWSRRAIRNGVPIYDPNDTYTEVPGMAAQNMTGYNFGIPGENETGPQTGSPFITPRIPFQFDENATNSPEQTSTIIPGYAEPFSTDPSKAAIEKIIRARENNGIIEPSDQQIANDEAAKSQFGDKDGKNSGNPKLSKDGKPFDWMGMVNMINTGVLNMAQMAENKKMDQWRKSHNQALDTYAAKDTSNNRGDYFHDPYQYTGSEFRPDQQMWRQQFSQEGGTVGSVVDMTKEELEEFLKCGGEVEIL